LSHLPERPDPSGNPSHSDSLQHPDECRVQTDTDGTSKSKSSNSIDLYEVEDTEKKQPDSGHPRKCHPKSQSSNCNANNHIKRRQKKRSHKLSELSFMSSPKNKDFYHEAELLHPEYYHQESQLKPFNNP